jgi:chemotaxis protein methyltransferase CheR
MGGNRLSRIGAMTTAVGRLEVEQFRALVADRLGLIFDDSKLGLLAEALRRRIEANHAAGAPYLERLAARHLPPEELGQIAQELTVTETYFYRGPDQIRAFIELALPQRLAPSAGTRKVRVLSAGCASGDEPYSLVIAIREQLAAAADKVSILAVDVNPAMIKKARLATYSSWSLRDLPAALRARWFRADGNSFVLDATIGRAVSFEERNLVPDAPELWQPQSWDVVFCRNMLMYLDPAVAMAIVARIAGSLVPGGFLFLGHAETLRGLSNDFHLCHTHETFYYRRKDGAADFEPAASARQPIAWPAIPRFDHTTSWVDVVRSASERIHALADASQQLSPALAQPATLSRPAPDLHRTLELLRHERFGQALEQLATLPAEQAREPEVLLLRAVSTAHSGALAEAEEVCRQLLGCDELNAGAHYVLALCREGLGDVQGAIEEDRVAVYLDPRFAMARFHLGLLARRKGQMESARRDLAQALLLLRQEDASRLILFGGGFSREALLAVCRAEIAACRDNS